MQYATMEYRAGGDMRPSFLFVDDLKDHHQEWLGSNTKNRYGVAALDYTTVFGSVGD